MINTSVNYEIHEEKAGNVLLPSYQKEGSVEELRVFRNVECTVIRDE